MGLMSGWNFSIENQMGLHLNHSIFSGVFEETLKEVSVRSFPGLSVCIFLRVLLERGHESFLRYNS